MIFCKRCNDRPVTGNRRGSPKYCDECRKAVKRESNYRHWDNNREVYRENARRWNRQNPEKRLEKVRKWCAENPERKRQLGRNAYHRDPAKFRAKSMNYHKSNLAERRIELFKRDGAHCGICDGPIPDIFDRRMIHVDHKVPVSMGGSNEIENLQLAHAHCNHSKGGRYASPV